MFKSHRGEALLVLGAAAFAFNGVISKIVLLDGLSAWRLTQVRAGGSFLFLFTYFLFKKRSELRATKKDLPWLIAFGIIGVAFVQSFYFVAIERINISTTLIIEFTAPIWILIYIKFILKRHVSKAMWVALALAFSGLLMVAQIWDGLTLDSTGLTFAILAAFCLAFYFICGEKLGKSRSTGSIVVWGFGVGSILWAIVLPLWNFPTEFFTHNMNLLGRFSDSQLPGWVLILWIILFGTVLPYLCVIGGLKLLTAATTSVIGMLEPVLAGVFAWIWLGESFNLIQLLGFAVVLTGIYLADKARNSVASATR